MSGIGPGDLVVRVKPPADLSGVDRTPSAGAPPLGTICRVSHVIEWRDEFGIAVRGWPSLHLTGAWHSSMFRKLNDGEEDQELIAKIKACKPVRRSVDA